MLYRSSIVGIESCEVIKTSPDDVATYLCKKPSKDVKAKLRSHLITTCFNRGIGQEGISTEYVDHVLEGDFSAWICLKKEGDAIPLAFALTTSVSERQKELHIKAICSAQRGQGQRLFESILQWCKRQNINKVSLEPTTPFASRMYVDTAARQDAFVDKHNELEILLGSELLYDMLEDVGNDHTQLEQALDNNLNYKDAAIRLICLKNPNFHPCGPIQIEPPLSSVITHSHTKAFDTPELVRVLIDLKEKSINKYDFLS